MRRSLQAVIVIAACHTCAGGLNADDRGGDTTLARIIDAWNVRQEAFRSYKYTWTESRTDFTQLMFFDNPPDESQVDYISSCELAVDDERIRYSFDGWGWRTRTGRGRNLEPRVAVSIFDGTDCFQYNQKKPLDERGQITYYPEEVIHQADAMTFRALSWFHRPLDQRMGGFDETELRLPGETDSIRGTDCIRVYYNMKSALRTLWVDPERDFTIRRTTLVGSQTSSVWMLDIDYHDSDANGWMPRSWEHTSFHPNGPMRYTINCDIEEHFLNPDLDDAEFQIEIPPGTLVIDARQDESRTYILGEDGEELPVSPNR